MKSEFSCPLHTNQTTATSLKTQGQYLLHIWSAWRRQRGASSSVDSQALCQSFISVILGYASIILNQGSLGTDRVSFHASHVICAHTCNSVRVFYASGNLFQVHVLQLLCWTAPGSTICRQWQSSWGGRCISNEVQTVEDSRLFLVWSRGGVSWWISWTLDTAKLVVSPGSSLSANLC